MISTRTVLVLGAGASMDYGFPSGQKLKALVWNGLRLKERPLCAFLVASGYKPKDIASFREDLLLSSDFSIDAFLEHHEEYREIGKMAIAYTLLPFENEYELFDYWLKRHIEDKPPEVHRQHWYQLLWDKLSTPLDKFSLNDLSVVTFNYDRSLEYYLFNCIKAKYRELDDAGAAELLQNISIFHVYGQLGSFQQTGTDQTDYVRYGSFVQSRGVARHKIAKRASQSIRIIHDPVTGEQLIPAQQLLLRAERIYLLGFGFDETNIKRLFLPNVLKNNVSAGTTLGLSIHRLVKLSNSCDSIKGTYLEVLRRGGTTRRDDVKLKFPAVTCYDFLFHCHHAKLT